MKPTLLILAAGMGSRYGGLKQIDPVGPNGEIIIDYSIHDALRAGFGKLVFVIRHYFEDAFREKIGNKFNGAVETAYAYQEMDSEIGNFKLPADREKPWGTGHAILVGKNVINDPFAVINADDYYGIDSFKVMADFLRGDRISPAEYAMAGFTLGNTLSDHGAVARGVCRCDERGYLQEIIERTAIEKNGNAARYIDQAGVSHALTGNEIVSMNLWGFHPSFFDHLSQGFARFLEQQGHDARAEMFITLIIDDLIKRHKAAVNVLPTHDRWFGVTYRNDMPIARRRIAELIDAGTYPRRLWQT
ncbi:MAG: nucleotidyltransferase [Phycisphaerae bacterium]|nr:nucleotidyltransferase [Phycisphaerae bacterium]